jgi:hypothetical protein
VPVLSWSALNGPEKRGQGTWREMERTFLYTILLPKRQNGEINSVAIHIKKSVF